MLHISPRNRQLCYLETMPICLWHMLHYRFPQFISNIRAEISRIWTAMAVLATLKNVDRRMIQMRHAVCR